MDSVSAPPTPRSKRHALVSGGGSGGHVFPGLAVVAELRQRGWRVSWAGGRASMEERLVGQRGLAFYPLASRPLVGQGRLGQLRALVTLCRSSLEARRLVRRLGARVVLGTGGYASAPAVVGGRLAGVPVLLLEPNAEPGVANRLLSRLASEALVADADGGRSLRCPATATGVPVRAEFFDVANRLPFGPPLRLLVLGGSQGARQLNELLPAALAGLGDRLGPVVVRHQAGRHHLATTADAYAAAGLPVTPEGGGFRPDGDGVQVEVVSFLQNMAGAMAESHLVVSRAGAITLAEICASGRPSLLVPLALAGGHQLANARRLEAAGAARVLAADADAAGLERLLSSLLGDRATLDAMAVAARALGQPSSASDIADRVEHWGEGRGS